MLIYTVLALLMVCTTVHGRELVAGADATSLQSPSSVENVPDKTSPSLSAPTGASTGTWKPAPAWQQQQQQRPASDRRLGMPSGSTEQAEESSTTLEAASVPAVKAVTFTKIGERSSYQ